MPYREDILREKTFKEDDIETDQRVLYTLSDEKGKHQAHRTSMLLASLLKLLIEKHMLSDSELNDMLFACIN